MLTTSGGGASSLSTLPTPCARAMPAPLALASWTKNCSSGSTAESPATATVTVWLRWVPEKFSVPLLAA